MVLDIFLTPKPRETIFSILTRAHILSGCISPLISLRKFTGHRGYKPLSSLPSNLNVICSSLHLETKPEVIIKNHTLFPLYRHFLPIHRWDFVMQGMLDSGATKSRMGLLKSHCGAADQLAYCYECVKDDIFKFGFPYWHREHMLVGVEFCHLHKLPLTKISMEQSRFGTRCLQLPGEDNLLTSRSEIQIDRLCFVAEQIALIINSKSDIFIDAHSYYQLLAEKNLLTKSSHLRMKALQILVSEWLSPLTGVEPFDELLNALNVERNWVANLVAGKEGMHHPFKHIALWGALDINFLTLIQSLQKVEQLPLPLTFMTKPEITKEFLQAAISQCGTATATAHFLNCSTQTVLAHMEKFGFSPKRKPKKLDQKIIEKILELSSKGISTAKIASELKLSVSTINRIERAHS